MKQLSLLALILMLGLSSCTKEAIFENEMESVTVVKDIAEVEQVRDNAICNLYGSFFDIGPFSGSTGAFIYVFKPNGSYVGTWYKEPSATNILIGYPTTIVKFGGAYHSISSIECSLLAPNTTYKYKKTINYVGNPNVDMWNSFSSFTTGDCNGCDF